MSENCPRCKGKIALCSTGILEVEPDAEPFLDGVEEALDPLQLGPPTTLYVRACVDCGYLAAYWIDDHLGKDLVRQLAALQAIVDKLPKYADGEPVVDWEAPAWLVYRSAAGFMVGQCCWRQWALQGSELPHWLGLHFTKAAAEAAATTAEKEGK